MSQITARPATGPLALLANGSFQTSTDTSLATLVGTRYDLEDGGEVILASTVSTSSATAGTLYQDPAIISAHVNCAVTTVTAYSANGNVPASVNITLGATALSANQYQGGYAVINAGTGKGQTLRIASNASALASGTNVLITFEDAPNVALSTSDSKVSLIPPHGANIITMPTTATNVPVGVAMYPIAAGSYGFLKSKGIVSAISDASLPAAGVAVAASQVTAGAVGVFTSGNGTASTLVGTALQTGVSAEARAVFLNL